MLTINKKFNHLDKQAGVTLLISILILSGIMLVVSTAAFFSIQELRASRAVVLSEPAIAAANSGGEQGIWALKRGVTMTDCAVGYSSTPIGSNAKVDSCRSYGAATINITGGTPLIMFLYNPNDINGDISLASYVYTNFQLTNDTGTYNVTLDIARINGNPVNNILVSPGTTGTIAIPAVSSGQEGRMKVTISSPVDATITVNTNLGMPEFPTVDAAGCSSLTSITDCNSLAEIFKRRLNITVPQ